MDLFLRDLLGHIIPVWRTGWDEKLGTVRPETVYLAALKAILRYYPHRRIIIHFVQPHYPFRLLRIKSMAFENFKRLLLNEIKKWHIYTHLWVSAIKDQSLNKEKGLNLRGAPLKIIDNPIYRLEKKHILRAYIDNLIWVMEYVKKLIEISPGKLVITSDHGDSFGEKIGNLPIEVYGHPPYIHIKQLLEVPWVEIEGRGSKKKILKELYNSKKV